jgi:hypothetical protein
MLPEWEQLLAAREADTTRAVRDEAIHVTRELLEAAGEAGRNLALVGLGGGESGVFTGYMRRFADAGWEVRVLIADAPVEVELARNQSRAEATGLLFDPDTVRRLSIEPSARFREWCEEPWIHWELYSTDPDR